MLTWVLAVLLVLSPVITTGPSKGHQIQCSAVVIREAVLSAKHCAETIFVGDNGANGKLIWTYFGKKSDFIVGQFEGPPETIEDPLPVAKVPPADGDELVLIGYSHAQLVITFGMQANIHGQKIALTDGPAITHGASGGAVLNMSGELVGILWGTSEKPRFMVAYTPIDEILSEWKGEE